MNHEAEVAKLEGNVAQLAHFVADSFAHLNDLRQDVRRKLTECIEHRRDFALNSASGCWHVVLIGSSALPPDDWQTRCEWRFNRTRHWVSSAHHPVLRESDKTDQHTIAKHADVEQRGSVRILRGTKGDFDDSGSQRKRREDGTIWVSKGKYNTSDAIITNWKYFESSLWPPRTSGAVRRPAKSVLEFGRSASSAMPWCW